MTVKRKKKNSLQYHVASNMLASGVCKPISLIIGYLYVPIVLNYLGIEKYGVWSTILTILSWISYFDIGIGNGLRNKLTGSLSREDNRSRKIVSSAYAFVAIIMICVVIISSGIISVIDWNRIFKVKDSTENLAAVVLVSVSFMALNFVMSICKNVLYALQRAASVSAMELMVQIVNLLCVLVAKRFVEGNLFVIATIYGLSMFIVNSVSSLVVYGKNNSVRPSLYLIDLKEGKMLAGLGAQFFVIQICALILFTTDSFIISCLYGAANVTPYATVNKLFGILSGVFSALLTPIWSAVAKAKAEKDLKTLQSFIKKLHVIMIPFAIGIMTLMILFRNISRLWLGQNLAYTSELILFGGIYCFLNIWTNTYGTIANGMEILKEQMVMAILQAGINLPLSLFLAKNMNMGSAGILLGTNISLLFSSIYLPFCIKKKMRGMSL